jgi:hypothetical protein
VLLRMCYVHSGMEEPDCCVTTWQLLLHDIIVHVGVYCDLQIGARLIILHKTIFSPQVLHSLHQPAKQILHSGTSCSRISGCLSWHTQKPCSATLSIDSLVASVFSHSATCSGGLGYCACVHNHFTTFQPVCKVTAICSICKHSFIVCPLEVFFPW